MKKIPKILTEEEQEKLLDSFNTRYICPERNKLMVKTTLNLGLRVSELVNLKWSHINLEIGVVDLKQCKGGKDRRVFMNVPDCRELALWKKKEKKWLDIKDNPNFVFTTRKNTKISTRYVRAMMKRQCERAGLDTSIHPHTLRHTFATDLYRKTKDIEMVRKALGHEKIETTMIYTHIVDDELEKEMKDLREPVKTGS